MKLILKRQQEEKTRVVKEAGFFSERVKEKQVEYKLSCRIVLSESEEAIFTKYVGGDYPMTYQAGRIREEGGIFGYGVSYVFTPTSPTEYSSEEDARHDAGGGPVGVGLRLSNLRSGVTYTERGGVGVLASTRAHYQRSMPSFTEFDDE